MYIRTAGMPRLWESRALVRDLLDSPPRTTPRERDEVIKIATTTSTSRAGAAVQRDNSTGDITHARAPLHSANIAVHVHLRCVNANSEDAPGHPS